VALSFDPEAAERWKSLCASDKPYERAVRAAVGTVLRRLDQAPELHRVGAIQFGTTPTTWARTVDAGLGADWIVIWTTETEREIRILRIEPTPSL